MSKNLTIEFQNKCKEQKASSFVSANFMEVPKNYPKITSVSYELLKKSISEIDFAILTFENSLDLIANKNYIDKISVMEGVFIEKLKSFEINFKKIKDEISKENVLSKPTNQELMIQSAILTQLQNTYVIFHHKVSSLNRFKDALISDDIHFSDLFYLSVESVQSQVMPSTKEELEALETVPNKNNIKVNAIPNEYLNDISEDFKKQLEEEQGEIQQTISRSKISLNEAQQKMFNVSRIIKEFSFKALQQKEVTQQLLEEIESSSKVMNEANKQLSQAEGAQKSSARIWVFVYLFLTFSLWIFDWLNTT